MNPPDTPSRLRLAAQAGAVRALADATDDALAILLREVCEALGWALGCWWLPDDDGVLHLREIWSDPVADVAPLVEASRARSFRLGEGLPGRVLEGESGLWLEGLAEDDGFERSGAAADADVHTGVGLPVPLSDDRRGVLEFFTRAPLPRDPDLLDVLTGVAAHLGQFVQRREAEEALRASEERLRFQARMLDAVGEAVIATDMRGRILYWNAFAEKLYGWTAQEALGQQIYDLTPSSLSREQARAIMDRLQEGEPWTGEFQVCDRDGREFPALVNDSPIMDEDGNLVGIIGTSTDITARKRAEDRQRFLAEASRVLASSLEYGTTLRSIASLAVPTLGDWCLVHAASLDEGVTHLQPVARSVSDEEQPSVERFEEAAARPHSGLLEEVLRSSGPVLGPSEDGPELLRPERLQEMGLRSLVAVPLRSAGEAVGVLTFGMGTSGRSHEPADVGLADELGRRSAMALENARLLRDAQEANRAKADFLAVVSHELRTPLNAIGGYADLLSSGVSGDLTDKQTRHVDRIKVGARHLAHLIDEILAYARVEAGREDLELEQVDLGVVAREALVVLEPDAVEKGLDMELDAPARGPSVLTDRGKVRQILVNLLSNAVKYTEEGRVDLKVRPVDGSVELEVRDTGIGIEPAALDRIFEPFWQAESPNTRTIGGTGLGLSVNRRLVDLLGGGIRVESEPGRGSTFTVRLPAAPPDSATQPTEEQAS